MKICPICQNKTLKTIDSRWWFEDEKLYITRKYQCVNTQCCARYQSTEILERKHARRGYVKDWMLAGVGGK